MKNLGGVLKSKDITLLTNVHPVKATVFPIVMYGWESRSRRRSRVDQDPKRKEGRAPKKWCFQTVVLEKTFESPLDSKEIKQVNLKENQHWILIGRTDAEALILWPPDVKSRFIGKDPDAGKDWRQEKRGMTEDEIVEWHHWFNGHELGKTLGDGEGQGSLVYCSPWGLKKSEMTWLLNNNNSKDSGNKDVIFSEKI